MGAKATTKPAAKAATKQAAKAAAPTEITPTPLPPEKSQESANVQAPGQPVVNDITPPTGVTDEVTPNATVEPPADSGSAAATEDAEPTAPSAPPTNAVDLDGGSMPLAKSFRSPAVDSGKRIVPFKIVSLAGTK